jgi:hypothetical protein
MDRGEGRRAILSNPPFSVIIKGFEKNHMQLIAAGADAALDSR